MKVIKKGRPQKGWAKQITCTGKGNGRGGCGAVLMVEESDLFRTGKHSRDESEYFVTFKCSECGVLTDINGYPGDVMRLPAPPGLGGRSPTEMKVALEVHGGTSTPPCGDHTCNWPASDCDECFRWEAEMRRG